MEAAGKMQASADPEPTGSRDIHQVRYIPKGSGGLYRYGTGAAEKPIRFVGMDGCQVSLGVYFRLNDDMFFAAHVFIWHELCNIVGLHYDNSVATALKIRKEVRSRLERDLGSTLKEDMRDTMKASLRMSTCGGGSLSSPCLIDAVQAAVREWVDAWSVSATPAMDMTLFVDHTSEDSAISDIDLTKVNWIRLPEADTGNWAFSAPQFNDEIGRISKENLGDFRTVLEESVKQYQNRRRNGR